MAYGDTYSDRKYIIAGIFITIGLILISRLFYLQVVSDEYFEQALRQARKPVTEYPSRGIIFDRNKNVLVHNEIAYDVMVIPKEIGEVDTVEVAEVFEMTKEEFKEKIDKIVKKNGGNRKTEDVFLELITAKEFVEINEQKYKLSGFRFRTRTVRSYPSRTAAHVLGYLGEVNGNDVEKDEFYRSGDYIGKSGLEQQYESLLRGKKGVKYLLKDVNSNIKGQFEAGALDIPSVPGANIITSLDVDLQLYGEKLMQHKKGSIVAIDPNNGEILCLISAPDYDPSLLVGRKYGQNYSKINKNKNKLFYNRAIQARYPPGSIFKTMQAAIAQQMGVGNLNTRYPCHKHLVGCHNHVNPLNLPQSIQHSCNPYYYYLFQSMINRGLTSDHFKDARMGFQAWREYVTSFGLGEKTNVDLPYEKRGSVPDTSFYDRYYNKRWSFRTIYSLAIGQGELLVVPIQMANLAAIMANKGYYYRPHLLHEIQGEYDDPKIDSIMNMYQEKHYTKVDEKYFDLVQDGMQWVVEEPGGTASRARVKGITICGKTGTAQNPHGEDHSVFIAFAPRENPKIAVATYVENSGGGGLWAAPIASLIIEKYLNDSIARPETEKRILEANLMDVKVEE